MTPDADPRPLAATQGDETAVPVSTSVRGGSGAQNGAEGFAVRVVICGPDARCADPDINRWYCMRGHDGAPPDVCPLRVCERRGANR